MTRPLESRVALLAVSKLVSLGFAVIPLRSPAQAVRHHPRKGPQDIPIEKRGKAPVAEGWASQDALGIEELIALWGDGEPGYNLGIRTGNVSGAEVSVIVVDLDSLEALLWARENLPETQIMVHTAKGQHWYYRAPPFRVGNKVSVRVEGRPEPLRIDVRGDGGQAVAPSSVHGTGHRYSGVLPWTPERVRSMPLFNPAWFGMTAEWEGNEDPEIRDGGERRPPMYVDNAFKRRRALAYLDHAEGTISGQGTASNECLYYARALVYGLCLPPAEAARIMHDHDWNTRCVNSSGEPYPWTLEELTHKCQDAYRLNFDKPFGYLLLEQKKSNDKQSSDKDAGLSQGARDMQEFAASVRQEEAEAYWWDFAVDEQEVQDPGKRGWPLTDTGNAERLVARFGEGVRYVEDRGVWSAWDASSGRWIVRAVALRRCSKIVARKISEEFPAAEERLAVVRAAEIDASRAENFDTEASEERIKAAEAALDNLQKWQKASESASKRVAMIEMAQSEHTIAVGSDAFDRYPFLLNVKNGVLDLSSGEPKLEKHDRDYYLTKACLVAWDPAAEAPTWRKCLHDWTGGDQDTIDYLQRAAGYAATGSVEEEALFLFYGVGQNGKSTFLNALHSVLGPYATTAPAGLLMETRIDKATPSQQAGLASLVGVRFVVASETDESARMSEAQVKAITCRDRISAKRMYEAPFEFTPSHHVFLTTNSKPAISGTDDGIWRRLQPLEWRHKVAPSDRDNKLAEKLLAERPGILRWVVEGAAAWQRRKLDPPRSVTGALARYRSEQDTIGMFLNDIVEFVSGASVTKAQLRAMYQMWCEERGYLPFGAKKFSEQLLRTGRVADEVKNWSGIAFRK